jgi:histidinol-phosphate aminotransferase
MINVYSKLKKREIGLNLNEHPLQPNEIISTMIDLEKLNLNKYLTQEEGPLLSALSRYTKFDEKQLVIGNGADELIANIIDCYVDNKVMIVSPTFGMYESYSRLRNKEIIKIELKEDLFLPKEEIINLSKLEKVDLIIICNPNNPTGNMFVKEDIEEVIASVDSMVLIDEAYFEFSNTTMANNIVNFDNLIVLRTLSKAFAAAGLRVGYAISKEKNVNRIRKMQMPFNINNFSQYYASVLLDNSKFFLEEVKKIIFERERLSDELRKLSVKIYQSYTNFILVKFGDESKSIYEKLVSKGIYLRDYQISDYIMKGTLRISVGSYEENNILIDQLSQIVGECND